MTEGKLPPDPGAPDGGADPAGWPAGQTIAQWGPDPVFVTRFADVATHGPPLAARMLELEEDPSFCRRWGAAIGSGKVYGVEDWGTPEAALVDARARSLFRRCLQVGESVTDLSWGSIYRRGDWCMPHSHVRARGAIVYFLDLGDDPDAADSDGAVHGHGAFCFADPRLKLCCQQQKGAVTTPGAPRLEAGTMIMFPGETVHFVAPYLGGRPRLTMSWNLGTEAIPGSPLPGDPPPG
ncbi:MAG: putative 2OG-Fe(II) oxygenase [Azospirillaceae bacterium]